MSSFILGSFYTKDTPYEDVACQYFVKSAMNLFLKNNLEWKLSVVDSLGTWTKNVAEKPKVIKEMLNSIPKDKNLLFVDADAEITEYPSLFETLDDYYDIAFHTLDWNSWYQNNSNVQELLSGTMWFKNNDKVRYLLDRWYNEAIKTSLWEQKVLERIIKEEKINLTIFNLSVEYCYINSMPDGSSPKLRVDKPIIIHHQVSRKLKRILGR